MPDRQMRTVLLVDDSTSMLLYFGMLLKRFAYKVITSRNAHDALRVVEETFPSLILTETSLLQKDGILFLKHLKGSVRFRSIPVILLASMDDSVMKDACMRLGSAAHLVKPVEPEVLYRTLQSASESVPRLNIRLSTTLKVVMTDGSARGGQRVEYATVLSEGGLYLRTLHPQPRNTLVPLQLMINDRPIAATAIVLYATSLGKGNFEEPGMGMKFIEIADADRDLIRRFIKDRLINDISLREVGGPPADPRQTRVFGGDGEGR